MPKVPDPYRIFSFWTGDNDLTEGRRASLGTFEITGLSPELITTRNINDWLIREHPLHPAYQYLSVVHRSDYLRPYFMYYYGGGYADIKQQSASWMPTVKKVLKTPRLFGAGYREIRGGVVSLHRSVVNDHTFVLSRPVSRGIAKWTTNVLRLLRPLLIGNGAFYFKSNSHYAGLWLKQVERRLDILLPLLENNPARELRDSAANSGHYPVPWAYLMGDINHPLAALYSTRLLRTLPRPNFTNYM